MSGFFAWVAWLTIHIFFLIGFRNRIAVLMNWAYSFLTLRRNAQLITGEDVGKLPSLTDSEPPRPSAPRPAPPQPWR
jgi:NADH dehydrogenase